MWMGLLLVLHWGATPAWGCTNLFRGSSSVRSPQGGSVPRDVVLAGMPSNFITLGVEGPEGDVDFRWLDDGLFGLPYGAPPGEYAWRDSLAEAAFTVVPTIDWSPGPTPALASAELDFDWVVGHSGCGPDLLTGRWALDASLSLAFIEPPESGGWYVTALHDDVVVSRLGVPIDGAPVTGPVANPSLYDRRLVCLDLEITDARGIVAEVVELPCQRRPLKPPLPACSAASTPAALLLAFLSLPALVRRRRGRP